MYLGIQKYFLSGTFDYLDGKEEVSIDVGIDGLKLFQSSNKVLRKVKVLKENGAKIGPLHNLLL